MAMTGTTAAAARIDSSSSSSSTTSQERVARLTRVPKRWHALDNNAIRSHIVAKLSKLFPALERARLSAAAPSPTTASVIQRLEWMLFHAAHSRREYANECTLERRVQALVTQQLTTSAPAPTRALSDTRKPSPRAIAGSCPRTSCAKRPRRASLSALSIDDLSPHPRASFKRRRRESFHTLARSIEPLPVTATAAAPRRSSVHTLSLAQLHTDTSSALFLNNDVDLVAQVFQFLDGHEVVRARAVNKFLAAHALRMVHALTLDVRALQDVAPLTVSELLVRCPHVRSLTVTNTLKQSRSELPRGYSAPTEPRLFGSDVVAQATAAFENGACPLLESLALVTPFEFATESDAIVACLDALARRFVQRRTAPLTRLVLDATFLGDARVEALAQLVTSAPLYFERLETLVLRANFVGEAGASALVHALQSSCRQLQALDVSSNILTDTDAVALAGAIARSTRRQLRHSEDDSAVPFRALARLGLDENFIGLDGFAALASAMHTRKRLVDVSCAHNCAPVAHAMRLFA